MRLSHRDFDQLQRTILRLHDLPEPQSFQQAVPGLFLRMIPAEWFIVWDSKLDMRRKRVLTSDFWENFPHQEMIQRLEGILFDHPFSRYTFETGDRTALKLSDFFSRVQLERSRLYNEFYRLADSGRFLATAAFNPRGLTTLNAGRPIKSRDFTDRDRLVMNLLRPHFEIARRAAELNGEHAAAETQPLEAYGLTPAEREVAAWLAKGKTNPEIAVILQTRTRTVEKHVERIFGKLRVENRTAAALVLSSARESE